ncbi:MAG: GNAT family N-acetyltransferase [Anaerolineales bacterium]|nr:GNAT family N-acetyltransferase [Anaerolineales bacterium]MCZ2121353.1 GNAT family N-acetyltransferase [Anaerolineales bacterium]
MSSIAIPPLAHTQPHLRPLNILRDLPAVADLIELCFSSTMDNDGRRYLQDMRRAGKDNSFVKWANQTIETASLPLAGFVWEENGKIVGNVSLAPFRQRAQKIYLIANVAVHPEYRRHGIARALTQQALQQARTKKANSIWLHVREDNPNAIDLYAKLGFKERARRTTWQAATSKDALLHSAFAITGRRPNDWQTQLNWLKRLYPDFLAWHRTWDFAPLRPGFLNWLYLLAIGLNIRQWTARKSDALEAALAWIPSGRGEALFAAIDSKSEPEALTMLLLQARRELADTHPKIVLEFPVGGFDRAIHAAGFQAARTLIWMQTT